MALAAFWCGVGVDEVTTTVLIRMTLGTMMGEAAAIAPVFRACTFLYATGLGLAAMLVEWLQHPALARGTPSVGAAVGHRTASKIPLEGRR